MRISTEGTIGLALALVALAGTGAIAVAQGPVIIVIGWILIAGSLIGGVLLAHHHFQRTRMIPMIGMIAFGIGFIGCAAWYFWPAKNDTTPVSQGAAPVADQSENGQAIHIKHGGLTVHVAQAQRGQRPVEKPDIHILLIGGEISVRQPLNSDGKSSTLELEARTWNTGQPVSIVSWSLSVTDTNGSVVSGKPIAIPQDGLRLPDGKLIATPDEALDAKTLASVGLDPISGKLIFYVPLTPKQLESDNTALRLIATDVYGNSISATQMMRDWPKAHVPNSKRKVHTSAPPPSVVTTATPLDDDLVRATGTSFPAGYPKDTIYAGISNSELKSEAHKIARILRTFETTYRQQRGLITIQVDANDPASVQAAQQKLDDLRDRTTKNFQASLLLSLRAAHFELLNRMNLPFPTSTKSGLTVDGYQAIMTGIIYNTSALSNVADYIDKLADKLH